MAPTTVCNECGASNPLQATYCFACNSALQTPTPLPLLDVQATSTNADGSYIASASYDMTVQIWEAATGRHVYTYSGHKEPVYTVAWSPNGRCIASGGMEGTVQVWNARLSVTHPVQRDGLA